MIIVLKPLSPKEDIERVENMVKARGLDTHVIEGAEMTIIGCIGDTAKVDSKLFEIDSAVDKVMHVQEPYKLANRAFHPEDSIINVSFNFVRTYGATFNDIKSVACLSYFSPFLYDSFCFIPCSSTLIESCL